MTIRAEAITHRGPTLGFRITEGDQTLCYIPDHEPALGSPLQGLEREWISGYDLARDADLLIHDCQYTDEEYPQHVGWGHSGVGDTLTFADRVGARKLLLFHHDPLHADETLDELESDARRRWQGLGHDPKSIESAREGEGVELPGPRVQADTEDVSTAGTRPATELSTPG